CDDVGRLFGDDEPHPPIFHLLVNHLRAIDGDAAAAGVGRQLSFRLKLLVGAGLTPQLGACAKCGASGPLVGFSGVDGGLVCSSCSPPAGFTVRPELPETMRAAIGAPLAGAPEPASLVARQFDRALTDLAEHHVGAKLRGLRIAG
ncbi:MAG: DNA repair protein RecO C-terminal domain-containing protein, partial [Solirubrobacteraceae bacterium]|nr:DNA repair protein RecO C-terminal domain-containing protein [Solirubrobacteraceae bacterium]